MRLALSQRLTALALAAIYALLSTGGQSLHGLSHTVGSLVSDAASDESACGCGEAGCFFTSEQRERAATQSDHQGLAFRTADEESGHDPHACGLCQTLSKIKLAAPGEMPEASNLGTKNLDPPPCESLLCQSTLSQYEARGPPARA